MDVTGDTPQTTQQQIGLDANPLYYAGRPKLDRFVIDAFNNQQQMLASFDSGVLNGMAGLTSMPPNLQKNSGIYSYNIPLTAEVMVFFNNSQPILSDSQVRQALVQAINENTVINGLGYPVIAARSPLLSFQLGYNPKILQLSTNVSAADNALYKDGWVLSSNGIRYKLGKPLEFDLFTEDNAEFNYVSSSLKSQWKKVGANVTVLPQQSTDLQTIISSRDYDSILYGISIGVDPDVFAYWDSSQAQPNAVPGLNLSLYKSTVADQALEEGRTRTGDALRAAKYQPFLQAWQGDAPALALYQPRYLYVTRGQLFGFSPTMINTGTDRYSNVANWEISEVRKTN